MTIMYWFGLVSVHFAVFNVLCFAHVIWTSDHFKRGRGVVVTWSPAHLVIHKLRVPQLKGRCDVLDPRDQVKHRSDVGSCKLVHMQDASAHAAFHA
jgi:hypothetical protein